MSETLYVDASAAVKAYIDEPGRADVMEAFRRANALATSRVTYVEVGRALHVRAAGGDERKMLAAEWARDWDEHIVVDLDQAIAEHAVALATHHSLRSVDAIHLASALALPPSSLRFATWDRRLWDAARAVGLRTVPAERP